MSEYGGIEIFFDLEYVVSLGITVAVDTDISVVGPFFPEDTGGESYRLEFTINDISGDAYAECVSIAGTTIIDRSDFVIGKSAAIDDVFVRVFIANSACSVYVNDKWVYTFVMKSAIYQPDGYVSASVEAEDGGTITLRNIRRVELRDKREAVWVDYEATSASAIGSVIQQRPVEQLPAVNRALKFTYLVGQETVDAEFVRRHTNREGDNPNVSIDGLVYGIDVAISTYEEAAEDVGFATRLYRLSELDYGTVRATRIMQEKAYERRSQTDTIARFDPRVQVGDIYHINKILSGTGRIVNESVIIEGISFAISDGKNQISIRGRKDK